MYNSNINLNLYKTFLALAESKSLSEASNKMNMEKTSISKNIKQLEDTKAEKIYLLFLEKMHTFQNYYQLRKIMK